jgi:hypothetical protein
MQGVLGISVDGRAEAKGWEREPRRQQEAPVSQSRDRMVWEMRHSFQIWPTTQVNTQVVSAKIKCRLCSCRNGI